MVPQWQVDAFSGVPFGGNPAAVCLLSGDAALSDELRLAIAAENNLSETAFVEPLAGGDAGGEVRWARARRRARALAARRAPGGRLSTPPPRR
jgi:predicted PhzF superfamily epimerase YddE/YHI9